MSINNHFADLIPKQNQEDNFFSDLVPSAPQLGSATLGAAVGSVKAPYKWGGVDPVKGMDCSGATCYVAKQFGVKIPRTSIEQYKDKRAIPVSRDQLQPGDLVFFDTGISKEKGRQVEGGKYVTHVGIYVGNGEFMHQSGDKQSGMSRAKLSHWQNKYIGAKRHAQINQQAALRGIPVPAEQRGLPQPTLKDVAKGVQQDARLADSANRRAGMRGADGNAFGDLIQARTPSIGSAPSGVAPVDLNAKVRDEFLSNASVAELIIALRKTGKPTTEESSWMQSKGFSGTPAENNAAIMAEVNRRGAGVLRAISPFVPKEVLELGSSVVTSPLGSSIRMTDPGASPEEMVAGGVDFAGSFMGLPLLDDAIKIVGKGISAASKSAIAKKIASKLSSQADWEKFRQSVEQMNIPAAQKEQIIQEVAPKVKPKTVKPKTIVDPELAAARKGMEGRQPRTAPVEVKPKVTPEAKESAPKGLRDSEQYQATIDEIKAQETNLETARSQVLSRIDKIEQSLKDPRSVKGIAQREALRKIRDAVQNATPSGEVVMPTFLKIKRGGQSFEVPTYGLMEQFGLTSERGLKNTRWFLREQVTINDAGTNYVFYKGQPGASKPEPTAPKATFTPKEDPNYDPGKPLDIVGMGKPKTIGEVVEPKVAPEATVPADVNYRSMNDDDVVAAVKKLPVHERASHPAFAEYQRRDLNNLGRRRALEQQQREIDSKKDANNGKTLQEIGRLARSEKALDNTQIRMEDGSIVTLRERIDRDLANGLTPEIRSSYKYLSENWYKRESKLREAIRKIGSRSGFHPSDDSEIARLKKELDAGNPKVDKYVMSRGDGAYSVITKAEYDYAISKQSPHPKAVPQPKVKEPVGTPKVKEPWEMTMGDVRAARENHTGDTFEMYGHEQALYANRRTVGQNFPVDFVKGENGRKYIPGEWQYYHGKEIEQALKEGKPVPAEVLADYPDLAAKPTTPKAVPQPKVKEPVGTPKVESVSTPPPNQRTKQQVIEEYKQASIRPSYTIGNDPDWHAKMLAGEKSRGERITELKKELLSMATVDDVLEASKVAPRKRTGIQEIFADATANTTDEVPVHSKSYKSDRIGVNSVKGETWWTNSHVAFKGEPPYPQAEGFTPSIERVIPEIDGRGKSKFIGSSVSALDKEAKAVIRYVFEEPNGEISSLDGKYVQSARKIFGKDVEFHTNGNRAAAVVKDGEVVGAIMPMDSSKLSKADFRPTPSKISTAAETARAELADAAKGLEKARKGTKRTKQSGSAYQPLNEAEITYFKAWVKSKGLDAAESVEEFVKHMADEFGDHADSIRWAVKNYLDETKVKAPSGANKADRVNQAESLGTPMPEVVSGKTLKQLEAQGKKDIASGYDAPAEMARLAKDGLAANEREIAAFVAHRSNLLDELRGLNKRLDGNITDEVREAINLQKDELMDRIGKFDTNLDQIKGTAARSLGTLRIGQTVNWSSLDEIKLEAKRRTGVELSEKQIKTIEKELDAQKELVKTKDARITELEAAKADAVVREVRRVPRKASIEQIRAERKQLFQDVKDILAEAKKNQVVGAGLGVFQSYMEASPELAKKVIALLKTYVDEFKFQTAKELSDQLLKDFPELGATEDDVRKVLAGVYDQQTARPQSDWQKIKGESRKIENRTSKLQEQEGVLRTGITVARDKRVIQKSRELEQLDLLIRANERHIQERLRAREQTVVQKIGAVVNAPRALAASIDLSAPGRQGWILSITNPKSAVAAFGKQMKAMTSRAESTAQFQKLLEHPKAVDAKKAGLYLADAESPMRHTEEAFLGNIFKWKKWNPIEASERAYNAYLNSVRMDAFDKLTKNITDPSDMKAIARYINVATGRGDLGHIAAGAADFANVGMFSARYQASRVQYLIGQPLWSGGTAASKKLLAKEYGKFIGGMGTIMALAKLSGGVEVSTDPYTSDFMKIKIGDTRIDLWAGMQQWAVLGSRLAKGKYSTTTGRTFDLNEDRYGAKTSGDVAMRFVRSKLNPQAGAVWTTAEKKDYLGRPASVIGVATSFLPISPKELVEGMVEDGWDRSEAIGLLNFLGISVNTFDPAKPKDDRPTKN